jgi:enoyl-CoA hydratase
MTGWTMSNFEHIILERQGAVGIVRLNRPKMLNALSFDVFKEIALAIDALEADDGVGCIVVTGNEKAFAAGADIKEMQPKTFIDMFSSDFTAIGGDRVANCRKPTIAAVSGYALGGGCELAMMCDIIIASETASRRLHSAPFPASAAPSGSPAPSANRRRWISASPAA